MKILITCDPEIPVPPKYYGGVERLVDGLIYAYKKIGNEIILLANKESTAQYADKIYGWSANYSRGTKNIIKNSIDLFKVCRKEKPDVIHSFSRLMYYYPTMFLTSIPALMTYERRISTKTTSITSLLAGKKIHFTSAAAHMINNVKCFKNKFTPIYNFIDTNYFVPDNTVEKEHLMFLGRIENIKGTKEAIDVAIATQQKLIIAGNIQPGHDDYFNKNIKPYLNNPLIKYIGAVDDEQKRYYLQRAKALLFPIKWEEPFGIVMIEAMACGTPIIGFASGSVPEVVKVGTGFIVQDTEQMIEATQKIDNIDRNFVRKYCVENFDLMIIAKQYLELLNKLLCIKK